MLFSRVRCEDEDLHSEAERLLCNELADVAEALDTHGLAADLRACARSELVAAHIDHEAESELCNCVGVLAWSVHGHDASLCA